MKRQQLIYTYDCVELFSSAMEYRNPHSFAYVLMNSSFIVMPVLGVS
jgi:hypothetical protein